MIAIGMVASFLTDNLTVGFILGMLFNMPLALFGVADWFVTNPAYAQAIRQWGALEQFRDFERGVLSLGGVTYFVALAAVMLYLSLVLIGRRHWQAREEGGALGWHYLVRAIALLGLAVGMTQIVQSRNFLRADLSSEKLSTLSSDTLAILRNLRDDKDARTIKIDAYVSPQVPTDYLEKKTNFLSTLAEFQALSGGKVQVTTHEIENYGEEANLAERTYGITPREIMILNGSERTREEIFLGAAITSGLGKVVIPFLGKGIPVEYELVRSIATVTQQKNLRVGILDTGIRALNPSSNRDSEWPLITELRKQYEIDDSPVDPSQPIKIEKYDVLLAVQPSMLGPQEMDHFVDAVRAGLPTAILEDPVPVAYGQQGVVGTGEPKVSPGMGMFGGGGQPLPKGDIQQLWKTLGIQMEPVDLVWQDYKPDQTVRAQTSNEWIFIDSDNGAQDPLNSDNRITSGLNQLLFLFAGSVTQEEDSKLEFEELAVTGSSNSGTVNTISLRQARNPQSLSYIPTSKSYIIGARIRGDYVEEDLLFNQELASTATEENSDTSPTENDGDSEEPETADDESGPSKSNKINAVVIADIDWIIPDFFQIRELGDGQVIPATQNVTFILNIIDDLADDDRFIAIRKRVRKHRTLSKIDEATQKYRDIAVKADKKSDEEQKAELAEAQNNFQQQVDAVDKIQGISNLERDQRKAAVQQRAQERLQADMQSVETRRRRELKQINYDLEQEIRGVQDRYKMFAILIPPIPPLLVALYVFFRRREAEQEGILKERLR